MSLKYNKVKGSKFETDLVDYLREKFPDHSANIQRMRLSGNADQGDIIATLPLGNHIRHIIIEAKNVQEYALSQFVAEVTVEVENWTRAVKSSGKASGIVIIKRRNKPIGQSYVIHTLDSFLELLG